MQVWRALVVAVALVLGTSSAWAGGSGKKGGGGPNPGPANRATEAPEIDPTVVGAVAVIVLGGGYLVARRVVRRQAKKV